MRKEWYKLLIDTYGIIITFFYFYVFVHFLKIIDKSTVFVTTSNPQRVYVIRGLQPNIPTEVILDRIQRLFFFIKYKFVIFR